MKQQLLLLKDVDGLGRSGDVVTAKPGHIRNYLLPQQMAVIADKHTLKLREKLQAEREKQAAVDRKESETLAATLATIKIETEVEITADGKPYGSVSTLDIARLLQEKEQPIERKHVILPQPIKTLGTHKIELRLKEGVPAEVTLEVTPKGGPVVIEEAPKAEEEEQPSEAAE